MEIKFFTDPLQSPNSREDVRLNRLGLYVYEDGRRVAVGFNLTPFLERPSIEVNVINANGEHAGRLTVIDTLDTNFSLTMHLRDKEPTDKYQVTAKVYYADPEADRVDVHEKTGYFDVTKPGDQPETPEPSQD